MPRDIGPSNNERAFVSEALTQGLRLDGRPLRGRRPATVKCGDMPGCVEIEIGDTRVFARVSAELSKPLPERPFDGIFNIAAELSPMASPAFESGRSNDVDPLLSRLLEKSLRRSSALDTEGLCLRAGRSVWALRVDLHVLSSDGVLIDACCAAAMAALMHFRLPATSVASGADGDGLTVYPADRRAPVPLAIRHAPYAVSTAFLRALDPKGGGGRSDAVDGPVSTIEGGVLVAIADPTAQELACSEGEVIVTANKNGEVCQIAKLGGCPADAVAVLEVVESAIEQVKALAREVDLALKKDEEKRLSIRVEQEARAENER